MGGFRNLRAAARAFVAAVVVVGAVASVLAWRAGPPPLRLQTFLLLGLAVAGGLVRIPLPVVGRLSLAYPFLFGSLLAFGPGASVLAGVATAVSATMLPVQGRRQPPHRAAFNIGLVATCASVSGWVYLAVGGTIGIVDPTGDLGPIVAYTASFTSLNLGLVAVVTHLSGEATAARSLRANFGWAVPGFLAGSSLATVLGVLFQNEGLTMLVLAAPFVYLMDLAYRARLEKGEAIERHLRQTADLYESVTRALALAIEAKDERTDDHLRRVQRLAMGVAQRLGLSEPERGALAAATLLHDIGKIAVPGYILTKPGRLTPEEMEKMRVHPAVGADILGAVPFPFPLAPIVRHHHERWDGTGYPDRLTGDRIPLGARILTLVDCYDALTTDRPYRKAVSREEALDYLRRESGRIFDPSLVETLCAHVSELDREFAPALPPPIRPAAAPAHARPEHGAAIGTTPSDAPAGAPETAGSECRALDEMAQVVGLRLDFEDTLTLLAAKLGRIVRHRSLVVYLFDDQHRILVSRFAAGSAAARLVGVTIPVGERIAGWTALHQRAFGDRSHREALERDGARSDLEGLVSDPEIAVLESSLAAPLSTEHEQLGVLAVYDVREHVFGTEERRRLVAAAARFAEGVGNALATGHAERAALTDPLTGVPNWRYFLLETRQRIAGFDGGTSALGLIAFRLEGLAQVRELYGGKEADRFLVEVAHRLARSCAEREMVARFGGDRFVMIVPDGRARVLASRSLEILRTVQSGPARLGPEALVQVRLQGVHAGFPADGRSPDALLRAIDDRLYGEGGAGVPSAFPDGRWSSAGVDD